MFDEGEDAEDQMSDAFGCIVITVIGVAVVIIVGFVLLIKSVL